MFKPPHGTAPDSFAVAFIKVVVAEILVISLACDEVIAGDEQAVGDGHDRTLFAAASDKAMVQGVVVLVFGACRTVGCFRERTTQPTIPLRVLPLLRLPALS